MLNRVNLECGILGVTVDIAKDLKVVLLTKEEYKILE
jgi:hypothetical protein